MATETFFFPSQSHLLCSSNTAHHHWVRIKIILSITDCQVVCSGVCPMQMTGKNLENMESRRKALVIYHPHVFAFCLLQVQLSVQPQPEATLAVRVCVQAHREFSLITRDTAFQAIMSWSDSAMEKGRPGEVMGRMTPTKSVVPCRYPGLGNQGKTKMPRQSCNGGRWYNSQTLIMTIHLGNHLFSFSNELSQRMGLRHKVQLPYTDSLKKKSYKWKLICN